MTPEQIEFNRLYCMKTQLEANLERSSNDKTVKSGKRRIKAVCFHMDNFRHLLPPDDDDYRPLKNLPDSFEKRGE